MEGATEQNDSGAQGFVATLLAEEIAGGVVLALSAVAAVLWATLAQGSYAAFVTYPISIPTIPPLIVHDVSTLVSNLLLVVFFAAIGLEIGRERSVGTLQDNRSALLPVGAALGGMAGAAVVYLLVVTAMGSHGVAGGWGIPMATDVAFTLAVLALLGPAVPSSLRVFLLTLAVADDVASVAVLAVVSHEPSPVTAAQRIGLVMLVLVVLVATVATRRRLPRLELFVMLGLALWLLLAHLGIEPTLAGVVVGILVPTGASSNSPGVVLERAVAPLSMFLILPLFALVATGVDLSARPWRSNAAVIVPLIGARTFGKMIGILGVSALIVRLGRGRLPASTSWRQMAGASLLCGIGFTVPLLFAAQSFGHQPGLLMATKLALLVASILAALLGLGVLWRHRMLPPSSASVEPDAT